MSECKVPLIERLRGIPQNQRAEWAIQWDEGGRATGHTLSPVGRLCHEAADRIAELEADAHGMYAEIMQWRAYVMQSAKERDNACAEVERLRVERWSKRLGIVEVELARLRDGMIAGQYMPDNTSGRVVDMALLSMNEARVRHAALAKERDEARDEVERLRDSLSVTGDTRHEAMEAAIRVAEAHSETIRQLRAEVERLRASAKETADAARHYMAQPINADDNPLSWQRLDALLDAALRGESVTTTPTPEQPTQSPEPTSSE